MKTSQKEMNEWVFARILEGLCQGQSLYKISMEIVIGLSNIIEQNKKGT